MDNEAESFGRDVSSLLPGWAREKRGKEDGGCREKVQDIGCQKMKQSDQDEEISADQQLNNRQPPLQLLTLCTSVSLICLVLTYAPLSVYLLTVSPYDCSAPRHHHPELTCLAASLAAQSPLLNILVLLYVLLLPCVWVSLSSNTCCRRSASLLSDDAQSSPPSILAFHPTVPFLTHTHETGFFLSFLFWDKLNRCLLSSSSSPRWCVPLFICFPSPPPTFSLDLNTRAAHPNC